MRIPIFGKALPGSTVTVYLTDGVTLASVYAAESGGAVVNAVTASSTGAVVFYYDDATYPFPAFFDVVASLTGYTSLTKTNVWNFFDTTTAVASSSASELDICNEALVLIGQAEITSLAEDSDAARACSRLYSPTRDAVLRAYPWTRAMKYDTLTVDATEPAWGYSYRYALPADLLRLLGLDYSKYVFKVVGGYVYTNEVSDDLNIRYTARITDPTDWDALLRKAVAMRLSHALAVPLAGDKALAKLQWELYQLVIREARSIDGQEGTIDPIESNDFTDFRA